MNDPKTYGETLVTFRSQQKFSYEQFAEYLTSKGFPASATQLCRWETAKPFPYACISLQRLRKLIQVLSADNEKAL